MTKRELINLLNDDRRSDNDEVAVMILNEMKSFRITSVDCDDYPVMLFIEEVEE